VIRSVDYLHLNDYRSNVKPLNWRLLGKAQEESQPSGRADYLGCRSYWEERLLPEYQAVNLIEDADERIQRTQGLYLDRCSAVAPSIGVCLSKEPPGVYEQRFRSIHYPSWPP
jgi:hypothetical protein